jgi:FkbM family methyltransferase
MGFKLIDWAGRLLRKMGSEILRRNGIQGTWIDVGAHCGELTLWHAEHNPGLRVYALEPNLGAAAKLMGRVPNYLVIPMAVAEKDGCADFYINAFEAASSLLPFNEEALRSWIGGDALKVDSVVKVPTIRLDTLMDLLKIQTVEHLKIDTQGMDLAVVKSAGSRLQDIRQITLEVDINPEPLYVGAPRKEDVVQYLQAAGFSHIRSEKQTNDQEENLTFLRTTSANLSDERRSR